MSGDEETRVEMPRRFLAHTAPVIALAHLENKEMLGYRFEADWNGNGSAVPPCGELWYSLTTS